MRAPADQVAIQNFQSKFTTLTHTGTPPRPGKHAKDTDHPRRGPSFCRPVGRRLHGASNRPPTRQVLYSISLSLDPANSIDAWLRKGSGGYSSCDPRLFSSLLSIRSWNLRSIELCGRQCTILQLCTTGVFDWYRHALAIN